MKRHHLVLLLGTILVAVVATLPLHWAHLPPASAQSTTILVAAAASLQDALKEIDPLFKSANPNIRVNYNFAASGPLQQQIEQGAPVDVFISAGARQMDALQRKGLIRTGTRRTLLTNRLVLVVPRNTPQPIRTFQALTAPTIKRIAVGEPRSVPAGQYAEEVFKTLGILDKIRSKFVFGNSVRNVLSRVESGDADAGVVYATDAKISPQVVVTATAPANSHSPIAYPMAVIATSRQPQVAIIYQQFLTSRKAQRIFQKYGFGLGR